MTTKLLTLDTELELTKEGYAVKYDAFIKQLDLIINKWFVVPYDSKCTRRQIRTTFIEGAVDIMFEIGFYNTDENRIDFGSDLWIDYSSEKNELRINHGTCGYYSKADIYQVRRAKLLAYIWEHISEIESELKIFAESIAPTITNYENKRIELESEIRTIKNAIELDVKNQIEESLVPGTRLAYVDDVNLARHYILFGGSIRVTKRTPKYIVGLDDYDRECKLKAADIIQHVYKKYMTITRED